MKSPYLFEKILFSLSKSVKRHGQDLHIFRILSAPDHISNVIAWFIEFPLDHFIFSSSIFTQKDLFQHKTITSTTILNQIQTHNYTNSLALFQYLSISTLQSQYPFILSLIGCFYANCTTFQELFQCLHVTSTILTVPINFSKSTHRQILTLFTPIQYAQVQVRFKGIFDKAVHGFIRFLLTSVHSCILLTNSLNHPTCITITNAGNLVQNKEIPLSQSSQPPQSTQLAENETKLSPTSLPPLSSPSSLSLSSEEQTLPQQPEQTPFMSQQFATPPQIDSLSYFSTSPVPITTSTTTTTTTTTAAFPSSSLPNFNSVPANTSQHLYLHQLDLTELIPIITQPHYISQFVTPPPPIQSHIVFPTPTPSPPPQTTPAATTLSPTPSFTFSSTHPHTYDTSHKLSFFNTNMNRTTTPTHVQPFEPSLTTPPHSIQLNKYDQHTNPFHLYTPPQPYRSPPHITTYINTFYTPPVLPVITSPSHALLYYNYLEDQATLSTSSSTLSSIFPQIEAAYIKMQKIIFQIFSYLIPFTTLEGRLLSLQLIVNSSTPLISTFFPNTLHHVFAYKLIQQQCITRSISTIFASLFELSHEFIALRTRYTIEKNARTSSYPKATQCSINYKFTLPDPSFPYGLNHNQHTSSNKDDTIVDVDTHSELHSTDLSSSTAPARSFSKSATATTTTTPRDALHKEKSTKFSKNITCRTHSPSSPRTFSQTPTSLYNSSQFVLLEDDPLRFLNPNEDNYMNCTHSTHPKNPMQQYPTHPTNPINSPSSQTDFTTTTDTDTTTTTTTTTTTSSTHLNKPLFPTAHSVRFSATHTNSRAKNVPNKGSLRETARVYFADSPSSLVNNNTEGTRPFYRNTEANNTLLNKNQINSKKCQADIENRKNGAYGDSTSHITPLLISDDLSDCFSATGLTTEDEISIGSFTHNTNNTTNTANTTAISVDIDQMDTIFIDSGQIVPNGEVQTHFNPFEQPQQPQQPQQRRMTSIAFPPTYPPHQFHTSQHSPQLQPLSSSNIAIPTHLPLLYSTSLLFTPQLMPRDVSNDIVQHKLDTTRYHNANHDHDCAINHNNNNEKHKGNKKQYDNFDSKDTSTNNTIDTLGTANTNTSFNIDTDADTPIATIQTPKTSKKSQTELFPFSPLSLSVNHLSITSNSLNNSANLPVYLQHQHQHKHRPSSSASASSPTNSESDHETQTNSSEINAQPRSHEEIEYKMNSETKESPNNSRSEINNEFNLSFLSNNLDHSGRNHNFNNSNPNHNTYSDNNKNNEDSNISDNYLIHPNLSLQHDITLHQQLRTNNNTLPRNNNLSSKEIPTPALGLDSDITHNPPQEPRQQRRTRFAEEDQWAELPPVFRPHQFLQRQLLHQQQQQQNQQNNPQYQQIVNDNLPNGQEHHIRLFHDSSDDFNDTENETDDSASNNESDDSNDANDANDSNDANDADNANNANNDGNNEIIQTLQNNPIDLAQIVSSSSNDQNNLSDLHQSDVDEAVARLGVVFDEDSDGSVIGVDMLSTYTDSDYYDGTTTEIDPDEYDYDSSSDINEEFEPPFNILANHDEDKINLEQISQQIPQENQCPPLVQFTTSHDQVARQFSSNMHIHDSVVHTSTSIPATLNDKGNFLNEFDLPPATAVYGNQVKNVETGAMRDCWKNVDDSITTHIDLKNHELYPRLTNANTHITHLNSNIVPTSTRNNIKLGRSKSTKQYNISESTPSTPLTAQLTRFNTFQLYRQTVTSSEDEFSDTFDDWDNLKHDFDTALTTTASQRDTHKRRLRVQIVDPSMTEHSNYDNSHQNLSQRSQQSQQPRQLSSFLSPATPTLSSPIFHQNTPPDNFQDGLTCRSTSNNLNTNTNTNNNSTNNTNNTNNTNSINNINSLTFASPLQYSSSISSQLVHTEKNRRPTSSDTDLFSYDFSEERSQCSDEYDYTYPTSHRSSRSVKSTHSGISTSGIGEIIDTDDNFDCIDFNFSNSTLSRTPTASAYSHTSFRSRNSRTSRNSRSSRNSRGSFGKRKPPGLPLIQGYMSFSRIHRYYSFKSKSPVFEIHNIQNVDANEHKHDANSISQDYIANACQNDHILKQPNRTQINLTPEHISCHLCDKITPETLQPLSLSHHRHHQSHQSHQQSILERPASPQLLKNALKISTSPSSPHFQPSIDPWFYSTTNTPTTTTTTPIALTQPINQTQPDQHTHERNSHSLTPGKSLFHQSTPQIHQNFPNEQNKLHSIYHNQDQQQQPHHQQQQQPHHQQQQQQPHQQPQQQQQQQRDFIPQSLDLKSTKSISRVRFYDQSSDDYDSISSDSSIYSDSSHTDRSTPLDLNSQQQPRHHHHHHHHHHHGLHCDSLSHHNESILRNNKTTPNSPQLHSTKFDLQLTPSPLPLPSSTLHHHDHQNHHFFSQKIGNFPNENHNGNCNDTKQTKISPQSIQHKLQASHPHCGSKTEKMCALNSPFLSTLSTQSHAIQPILLPPPAATLASDVGTTTAGGSFGVGADFISSHLSKNMTTATTGLINNHRNTDNSSIGLINKTASTFAQKESSSCFENQHPFSSDYNNTINYSQQLKHNAQKAGNLESSSQRQHPQQQKQREQQQQHQHHTIAPGYSVQHPSRDFSPNFSSIDPPSQHHHHHHHHHHQTLYQPLHYRLSHSIRRHYHQELFNLTLYSLLISLAEYRLEHLDITLCVESILHYYPHLFLVHSHQNSTPAMVTPPPPTTTSTTNPTNPTTSMFNDDNDSKQTNKNDYLTLCVSHPTFPTLYHYFLSNPIITQTINLVSLFSLLYPRYTVSYPFLLHNGSIGVKNNHTSDAQKELDLNIVPYSLNYNPLFQQFTPFQLIHNHLTLSTQASITSVRTDENMVVHHSTPDSDSFFMATHDHINSITSPEDIFYYQDDDGFTILHLLCKKEFDHRLRSARVIAPPYSHYCIELLLQSYVSIIYGTPCEDDFVPRRRKKKQLF